MDGDVSILMEPVSRSQLVQTTRMKVIVTTFKMVPLVHSCTRVSGLIQEPVMEQELAVIFPLMVLMKAPVTLRNISIDMIVLTAHV